jgi:cyclopropane-fatty-acyl-phospholipid synthase
MNMASAMAHAVQGASRPRLQSASRRVRAGWLDRLARRLFLNCLQQAEQGEIRLVDAWGETVVGRTTSECPWRPQVLVHDPALYRRLAVGGSIAAGETFMDGLWSCDDLTGLLRIVLRNPHAFAGLDGALSWIMSWYHKVRHAWRGNTREGSRQNIADHYDLGNDFYRLFLDDNLMYSCAVFERPSASLEEASFSKNEIICRKLALTPQDHLLEIGTGWGGFALQAASRYGCRVTTTTISRQQYELACQRVRQAGLADRITVLLQDYRDLRGTFDKLVSIEMIEAVGQEYLDDYFRCCGRLLRPQGTMVLQSITMAEQHYERYRRSADFIQRHIFPGSHVPAASALRASMGRASGLSVRHLEDLGLHYAETLRHWRSRFLSRLDQVSALGYPERFVRMWDYYLCYCEAGFAERNTGLVQLVLVNK